jgi:5'-3' exoribonuclease 2
MGVPAFFKWLTLRYPKIIIDAYDEAAVEEEVIKQDVNEINLQGMDNTQYVNPHVDNVYFDMNGIIHPCTHPTNGKQPLSETEMFNNIFEYVDRILRIVRPRRLIYFAVDGVAPRAKINQQRSRRFRGALDEELK